MLGTMATCAILVFKLYFQFNPAFEKVASFDPFTGSSKIEKLGKAIIELQKEAWGSSLSTSVKKRNPFRKPYAITLVIITLREGRHNGTRVHFDWASAKNILIRIITKVRASTIWVAAMIACEEWGRC